MTLSDVCDRIITDVISKRTENIASSDKQSLKEKLMAIINENNYSFIIDRLNINYDTGDNNSYPVLCGDAIMHYAASTVDSMLRPCKHYA